MRSGENLQGVNKKSANPSPHMSHYILIRLIYSNMLLNYSHPPCGMTNVKKRGVMSGAWWMTSATSQNEPPCSFDLATGFFGCLRTCVFSIVFLAGARHLVLFCYSRLPLSCTLLHPERHKSWLCGGSCHLELQAASCQCPWWILVLRCQPKISLRPQLTTTKKMPICQFLLQSCPYIPGVLFKPVKGPRGNLACRRSMLWSTRPSPSGESFCGGGSSLSRTGPTLPCSWVVVDPFGQNTPTWDSKTRKFQTTEPCFSINE